MTKKYIWVGGAIGIIINALSIVKLVSHFFDIGLSGIPNFILASYSDFVADIRYWLLEVPFDLVPPEWVVHSVIAWSMFSGSNLRFLTYEHHGKNLFRAIGDVGRGTREAPTGWLLQLLNVSVALTGPLFSVLVLVMWLANRKGGPTGVGHWGDRLMISNRAYTVIISKRYLVVLALAPMTAALILGWNAASNLPRPHSATALLPPHYAMQPLALVVTPLARSASGPQEVRSASGAPTARRR